MSNYISYLEAKLYEPSYFQRNFEHDLSSFGGESKFVCAAKRVALIALPFIALYKPFGSFISLVMGTMRTFSNCFTVIVAFSEGKMVAFLREMGKVALSVLSLVTTFFQFTLGALITTGVDCILSAYDCIQYLREGKIEKAIDALLQTVSSALYLALIFSGALEVTLASLIVQAILSLFQAKEEFFEGKYLEGIAKTLMGAIRFYEAGCAAFTLKRRDELFDKFALLLKRIKKGKEFTHLVESELNLVGKRNSEALNKIMQSAQFEGIPLEDRRVFLIDVDGNEFDFGTYFHGYGKALVKGNNICFHVKEKTTELDFKVNHAFRDVLQNYIDGLELLDSAELQEFLSFTNSSIKGIHVEECANQLENGMQAGSAFKIRFDGVGEVVVGGDKDYYNLFDRVVVKVEKQDNIYQMHELLSVLGLEDALRKSSPEDIERIKVGQLFRTFSPREATPFERTSEFFSLSIPDLKNRIREFSPSMSSVFEEYLPKMEAREILPGKVRYSIRGLADKAHEIGVRALTAGVMGRYMDEDHELLFSRVASMIKMGMLSTETRFENGIKAAGLAPQANFWTGGADCVYTQLITEDNCKSHLDLEDFFYRSDVRVLLSLDALETGTYGFHSDDLGIRSIDHPAVREYFQENPYLQRDGILDFLKRECNHTTYRDDHEVLLKERVPPSMIKGIIVPEAQVKNSLIAYFKERHIIQHDGSDTILGIPVDRFIRVGRYLTEELVA